MLNKKPLSYLLIFALLVTLNLNLLIVPYMASPNLYEYYNLTDNGSEGIYENYWLAQTFTVVDEDHNVTSIKLKMWRDEGDPETIVVGIRTTDDDGHPNGTDLTYGTLEGALVTEDVDGEWYEINVTEYTVLSGIKYAIVVRAPNASGENIVYWLFDGIDPSYIYGKFEISLNSGDYWTSYPTRDLMFEVWGKPANETIDVTIEAESGSASFGEIITFDWSAIFVSNSSSANVTIDVLRNGTLWINNLASSSFTDVHSESCTYNYSASDVKLVGTYEPFAFETNTVSVTWGFWSGNIFFYNESSPTWAEWNMSTYNIDLLIYSSEGTVRINNVTDNPLYVSLNASGAFAEAILTINGTLQYGRTQLFEEGNLSFYLPDAGIDSVSPYTFTLVDYTLNYKGGIIRIYLNNTVLTSGFFDATNKFTTYLINLRYYDVSAFTSEDEDEYVFGYIRTAPSDLTAQLIVGRLSLPDSSLYPIVWNAQWSGSNILIAYNDTTLSTYSVLVRIYNITKDILFEHTYTTDYFQASYAPVNLTQYYYAFIQFDTESFGLKTEAKPVVNATSSWSIDLPDVFGLGYVTHGQISFINLLALTILVFLSAAFTAEHARVGAFLVALFGILFIGVGWLPTSLWIFAILAALVAIISIFGSEP